LTVNYLHAEKVKIIVYITCYHRVVLVARWYHVLGDIHACDIPRVPHDVTKRSVLIQSLYKEKSVALYTVSQKTKVKANKIKRVLRAV